jgi:hypothetical protein
MNNKKTVWIIVIIVVVIIIGIWIWAANSTSQQAMMPSTSTSSEVPVATSTASSTADTSMTPGSQVGLKTGVPAIAYANALKTYLNKRIQFSTPQGENSCAASPNSLTFRSGVSFMLDNRMPIAARIHLTTGVVYNLPAYSFQIIALNTPATYGVDCNSSQNVVTLQVQK